MKARISLAILILAFSSACNGTIEIGIEHTPANPIPTATATTVPESPTPMVIAPTPSNTISAPTLPAPPDPPAAPSQTPGRQFVQIYLIGLEDNGQGGSPVGCGDSTIPVQVEITPTQGVLKAALEKLLSIKDQYYGQSGLYDALYQSDLQVESVTIEAGKTTVNLTGSLILGGECDDPRVQAQLEKTVLQFPSVTSADIFINGKTLAEALSLK
jgi:hypothetical protein